MTGTVFARVRSLLIRGVAVVAVVLTYALGNVGTQVLSVAGLSSLALTTASTQAQARRFFVRRRRFFRRRRRRY